MKINVPIIVKLAEQSMTLKEVTRIRAGSIIEFNKPWDTDLDLLINNKTIGHGQAVKVGEKFGLRISKLISIQDTIKAMGS